jgi:hypothetical protein
MGWPTQCAPQQLEDPEFTDRITLMLSELYESGELLLDFFSAVSLTSQDVVQCTGERHQVKDDRWVYISYPQQATPQASPGSHTSDDEPLTSIKCVALVKALVRVTLSSPDSLFHPACLSKHGLRAPLKGGALVQAQPLRLALVDHWRAVACGEAAGYCVTDNPETGETPDLMHVFDLSKDKVLRWDERFNTFDGLQRERQGARFYGEMLCDIASFQTQLVATTKICGKRGAHGRYFMTTHKASGRQF